MGQYDVCYRCSSGVRCTCGLYPSRSPSNADIPQNEECWWETDEDAEEGDEGFGGENHGLWFWLVPLVLGE